VIEKSLCLSILRERERCKLGTCRPTRERDPRESTSMALTSNPRGLNDVTAENARDRDLRGTQFELCRITPRSALDTRYRTPCPESSIAKGIIGKKDIRVRCSSRVEWTSSKRSRDARSHPRNYSPKNQSRAANGFSTHEGNKQFRSEWCAIADPDCIQIDVWNFVKSGSAFRSQKPESPINGRLFDIS